MTRDEAIGICKSHIHLAAHGQGDNEAVIDFAGKSSVDMFIALGMLKLDEPKRDDECWHLAPRIVETLKGAYVGAALRQPLLEGDVHFIIGWLESAGLKIVEK